MLRLDEGEFYSLSMGEYHRICRGEQYKEQEKWRHTRSILTALTGKDMRMFIELPGDFDGLEVDTVEHKKKILHAFNVYKKWGGDKLN